MTITGAADVDKNSFGAKKRFAVVSISSMKTFQAEKGLTQLFKSTDEIPGANTQPLIDKLRPKILETLGRSKSFTLVPERSVLSSAAYRAVADDERAIKVLFMTEEMNTAANYKYLSDKKKLAKLAQDLGVDGVIAINTVFHISSGKSALSINGLSLGAKQYSASVSMTALAYNRAGEQVWKDSTMKMAEPGDTKAIILIDYSNITGTSYEKLHPSAVEIGGKAVEVLLARFEDTIAGRSVSSWQSAK